MHSRIARIPYLNEPTRVSAIASIRVESALYSSQTSRYIYIYREREREREGSSRYHIKPLKCTCAPRLDLLPSESTERAVETNLLGHRVLSTLGKAIKHNNKIENYASSSRAFRTTSPTNPKIIVISCCTTGL